MTLEQKFYQWFRKQLPITADVNRIETTTMAGMPDTNICLAGREVWVELKVLTEGRILIRKGQNAWGHRRAFAGGQVFIACRCDHAVLIWKFPDVEVEPYSKYLSVRNAPRWTASGSDIKTILFP